MSVAEPHGQLAPPDPGDALLRGLKPWLDRELAARKV